MTRFALTPIILLVLAPSLWAQAPPSYAKQIRPFLAKYCSECHNAREMKAGLNLETYKAMREGSERGPVLDAGKADNSLIVALCEGKEKPKMPPAKAKFQPKKEEVALLRAWVAAGAKDDSTNVKIALPQVKPRIVTTPPVKGLVYCPETEELIIARDSTLCRLDLKLNPPSQTLTQLPGPIAAISRVPRDQSLVAIVGRAGESAGAVVYSPTASIGSIIPLGHADAGLDVAHHPTRPMYATAGYDTQIRFIDGPSGKIIQTLKEHSDAVYGLAFSPDGSRLASVSADRAMKVWDVATGKLLYTLGEATDWLYAVAWSPDGKHLVSAGVDKSIRVYTPAPTGAKLRVSVFAHEGPVLKLVFTGDSKTLYSVGEDRVVKAWDIERMVERKVYDPQPETVLSLALRESAGQFIVGRYDGVVQLIDMKTGKVVREFGAATKTSALLVRETFVSAGGKEPQADKSPPIQAKSVLGSPATGQKISLPATIDGILDRAGAVHFFRFDVKKGQPLGIKVSAAQSKSKIDAVLLLADLSGRILAESNEGHLGHTFAEAGSYAIGVRDRDYKGGADFKYRLDLGTIPVISAVYPLGLHKGTRRPVHVEGVFLDQQIPLVDVPADAAPGSTVVVPVTSKFGTPLGSAKMLVGEYPDVFENAKPLKSHSRIPVPGTANGQIAHDGQTHVWTFSAKKGQRLVAEVNARRLGSRLDSIIEILDKNDQPVPRAVLRSQAKTFVTFRDNDSATPGIRIEAWSELATNDLLYVGTELMKIQALPTHPDADCFFFSTEGKRLAFLDTTPTHHSNNAPMYKVTVHPPGTTFPPNGYPVFTLYCRNDDGGPGFGRDSRILFDPPADGDYKVRIADTRGMGGVNFGYRLTVRPPQPGFNIRFTPAAPVVSRGGAIPLTVMAERLDGYDGPIDVRFENLPAGFSAPATTIEPGTYSTAVALYAPDDSSSPTAPLKAIGEAVIDGNRQVKQAVGSAVKVIEPGDIRTWTDEAEVAIKPGGQTKLKVHIERRNGFAGRIPLDVKGLPHGVRVLDIGLNGILITERETARTIVLYAEPWVQPTDHPFVVLGRREGKNTEHAAKSVLLRVK